MICADPNETAPLSLKSDAKLPIESRPTFRVRFFTESELRKLRRMLKDVAEAAEKEDEDKTASLLNECLRFGIVGADNLVFRGKQLDFDQIRHFGDYFTAREMWELAYGQIEAVSIVEQDRLFSEPSQGSERASSAADALEAAK